MSVGAAGYLFLLGLACGVALLSLTAYLRLSPPWLKWLLIGSGVLVISRYAAMFALATAADPSQVGWMRHCWFATSLALPLQSVFAVDQLIRHPAMTPRKLLVRFAPFLAVYAAVMLVGVTVPMPDRILGWTLRLTQPWQGVLSLTHLIFVLSFLGVCGTMIRKIPVTATRVALAGLMLGQLALTLDGIMLATSRWYFRPYLFSEMLVLIMIWHAHRTAETLP